ncbi:MAG: HAMP domain-containing histidine kinase [Deltaproteobacteria bacterium]|nr:HAMP domain-containing histidine kinase [Deltaproteobacteria bacterium]MBI3387486.1 HAMP domain-containing histidine kinase [Deltaproteobacteria bacterium]
MTKAEPTPEESRVQTLLLLRWVLIIATSYLLLFSRLQQATPAVALFVAGYFASNLALTSLLPRMRSRRVIDVAVVLFDTVAICFGLVLTGNVTHDFFLLYFLIMFIAALTERLGLVVGAAVLACLVHLMTLSRFVAVGDLVANGYLLRIPFFLVVALFFGHLVEDEGRARERARLEFVSTVSHDLKSPLGVIQSIAELLLDDAAGALTNDQAQLVQRIRASAHHLIALSHNLLNKARIDAGRLTLQPTPEDLANLVANAVERARCAGDLKGITLKCSAATDLPIVQIDTAYIERVVSNLLDNAIKFTPRGGMVDASVSREGDQLVLRVADTGRGIAAAELPSLFERDHRRAQSSREGSGFGLFIVQAIVSAHGGAVEMESDPGRGTTATVRLPIAALRAERSSPPSRWWRILRNDAEPVAPA